MAETIESHQTVSPSLNQDVLECSPQFPVKLLLQKLECEALRWETLSVQEQLSLELQGSNVWSPKHAELSQVCPSQSQLGNAKEMGSKVMPNPGSQTQETLSKDGSTQTVRKFSLIPSLVEEQNQNWRNLYIALTYKHYINLLKNPIYTVTNDTYIKQRGMETKPKEIHSDCMFCL